MKLNRTGINRYAIGIEIGGTKTQVGIGSPDGHLLPGGVIRKPVEQETGAKGILDDLVSMVETLLESKRLTLRDVERIGIGFGGVLDASRGITLKSFQISGWENFPLRKWAEKQWRKPVLLENDASTAGLAEFTRGNGRTCSRLFYITVGSGIGGGWIVNGRIDNGQGLGAAEIGHTWVSDPVTGEPAELEQICSGWGIGHRAQAVAAKGDTLMNELAGSVESIDAKVVYSAARQGDAIALQILDDTCKILGKAIANVTALLHPERIILGGGVSMMGPIFWKALQREFRLRVMPVFSPHVDLVQAGLKEDVVLIGALCLSRDQLL